MEPTLAGPLFENLHSAGDDHVEDEVLQISGGGTLVPGRMDWGSCCRIPRGFGFFGDCYVTLFISIAGSCRGTGGDIGVHHTDITRCQWDRYCGGRMLSLCGINHGIAGGILYAGL